MEENKFGREKCQELVYEFANFYYQALNSGDLETVSSVLHKKSKSSIHDHVSPGIKNILRQLQESIVDKGMKFLPVNVDFLYKKDKLISMLVTGTVSIGDNQSNNFSQFISLFKKERNYFIDQSIIRI